MAGPKTTDPSPWFTPPSTREQSSEEPPASPEPVAEEPAAQQALAEQPAAEQPATEQPATEQPATEQPVAEEPTAGPSADDGGQGTEVSTYDLLARVAAQLREYRHPSEVEPPADQVSMPAPAVPEPRRPRFRLPRRRERPDKRPIGHIRGALLLLGALIVAAVLAWTTVTLAQTTLTAKPPNQQPAGPLADPVPALAGTLPLRPGRIPQKSIRNLVATFRQRFDGMAAGVPDAVHPGGLYGEPGTIDPATGRTAWIMYLGLGSTRKLGVPAATVNRLMQRMLGSATTVGPWPVRSGARGGRSECTVAVMGSTKVAVCGWATERTTGALMSPVRDTPASELAVLMVQMRYELQLRAGQHP